MQELLAVLITWISVATGMPAVERASAGVVRASSAEMVALRLVRAAPGALRTIPRFRSRRLPHLATMPISTQFTTTKRGPSYLERGWTGDNPRGKFDPRA